VLAYAQSFWRIHARNIIKREFAPHISVSRPVLALNIATPRKRFSETALHQQRGRHSYQVLPADLAPYMRQPVPDAYQRIPQAHNTESTFNRFCLRSLSGNNIACPCILGSSSLP